MVRLIGLAAALAVASVLVFGSLSETQAAPSNNKVLILDTTVSGGAGSDEALAAVALGLGVDVVDATAWGAMTQGDFAAYRAIILGDDTCGGSVAAAEANSDVWGPAVTGNIVIIGTDPAYHSSSGGLQMTNSGIAFAVDDSSKTGAYITLSCYGAANPVEVLAPFGTFVTDEPPGCFDDVHIVAEHPAIESLTDADIGPWGCSVHEIFTEWPADFKVLAMARVGTVYTAPDGTVGTPYILANGEGLGLIGEKEPVEEGCEELIPGIPCGILDEGTGGGGGGGGSQTGSTPGVVSTPPPVVPTSTVPPVAPTQPGGGQQGIITAPDTGSGPGVGSGTAGYTVIAALLALTGVMALGASFGFARKR